MAAITTYDDLVALARGLEPGDVVTIGPDEVAPQMVSVFAELSLAPSVRVASASVVEEPASVRVTGTAALFGLPDLATVLTFAPAGAEPSGPFTLAITTDPAGGTQWQLVSGFVLADPSISFAPSPAVEVIVARIGCSLVIGTSHTLTLPISCAIPTYPGLSWVLSGSFEAQPLTVDAFSALAGGLVLSDYLPAPLDTLARFGMTAVEVAFDPAETRLAYVGMEIAYTDPWSALGIIDVPAGGVTLKFLVDFRKSAETYVELVAAFDIASVPVNIGAHFAPDNFFVWGRLQQGRTVAIADVFAHFHVTLPDGFPGIEIGTLSLLANISEGQYSFDLVARIDAGSALKVNDLTISVSVATQPATKVDADFHATLVIDRDITLFLGATYDGGGGGLTLAGSATDVPIGKMITYWASEFGIAESQIPEPIRTLALKTLTTRYNTATGDFHFLCVGDFTIYDTPVEVSFSVDIVHPASPRLAALPEEATVRGSKGYSATFGGTVVFAENQFDIRFNTRDTAQSIFVADYLRSGEGTVRLHDLVASVSEVLAALVPEDISITLKVVKFAYLKPAPGGGAPRSNHFLFGVELGASIGLSDIPLIGDKLPSDLTVSFDQLQFAYAKPGFDKDQAADVNQLLPAGVGPIPAEGLVEGVLVSSILKLGDAEKTLSLTIPTGPAPEARAADAEAAGLPLAAGAEPGPQSAPASLSINVQKQFGPIGIRKLGLTYKNKRLFVTGDVSLDAAILSIGLLDLGIGSKVDAFDPAATLSGLTISVEQGPIRAAGGLYGTIDPLDFYGALQVSVPSLTLGALGGYAQLGSDPSFFMYVSVNRPLFGYPFFFLDGIAGGLGFNRDLLLPDIDGVADFPLVAWATGKNPPGANPNGDIARQIQSVTAGLAGIIPPRVGQYWVAAGIKFSSFKVLESFALVTVVFGTEFKFALLGLTTASLPPQTGPGVPALGHVEMALRASFSPVTGILEIEAKLTPASYILDRNCILTGGFAYYMWFKDNPTGDPAGYHAGDFVVTLGGYNPAYAVPAFFPKVPRLGFNWRVDSHTTIQGGIYFALTPSALMAGGALEAVWQSGDLRAWFTAHADFLLSWKPFYYSASIGLSIGASYKLDLWFTSVTISVHVGVQLDLWGPPFGGSIEVDLSVISFTVSIGNRNRPAPQPIPWTEFKTSFLPRAEAAPAGLLAARAVVETDAYCLASVASGLIKDLSDHKAAASDPDWVISPETLELVTMTALPSKAARLVSGGRTTALPVGDAGFGVGPVGVAIADFASEHSITVNRLLDGAPDPAFDVTEAASISLTTSNLPSATWGGKLVVNPSIDQVNKTPANISNLAVGYSIKAKAKEPDHTPLPIDIAILQQDSEGTVDFAWLTPTIPTTDPFDQATAMPTFQRTLLTAAPRRAALIAALNAPGLNLGIDPDVDVAALAASADTVLLHAPVLAYLGEERAR
ncbi:DUF6603 domain-containing protein [Ancylobacter lacus]|uniref:DUF6603 domain-containing protein n=1 Tax=Ancylobacter lacus TaxID=2579970 RepID=UPI001BCC3955|nr:DUF6603 domain-containing protein [Ancylobacter lacus]MBS7539525.1 hypothetical protein [Ancylobacter lacus]